MMLTAILLGSVALGTALGLVAVWLGLSLSEDHILPL